jgi:hypothetical protein
MTSSRTILQIRVENDIALMYTFVSIKLFMIFEENIFLSPLAITAKLIHYIDGLYKEGFLWAQD